MIHARFDQQERFLDAARTIQKTGPWRDDAQAIGFCDDEGRPRGIVVLENFTPDGRECDVHLSSDGGRAWASRSAFARAFGYAFGMLGVSRLNAPIAEANIAALTFALKAGFRFEGRKTGAALDGGDVILLGMTADRCRWIEGG